MIELPKEHELIGFFECEPELLDTDVKPWVYNAVKFTTKRGNDEVIVKICASFGEFSIPWKKDGNKLITMYLIDLDRLTVEIQQNDEFLTATGMYSDQAIILKLRLKPRVEVEFKQQCIK